MRELHAPFFFFGKGGIKIKRKDKKNPIKTQKIHKNHKNTKKSIKMPKNYPVYTHTVCIYNVYMGEEGPLCTLLGKRVPTSLSCRLGSPVFRCGKEMGYGIGCVAMCTKIISARWRS